MTAPARQKEAEVVLRKKREVSADRRGLMSMLGLALANRKGDARALELSAHTRAELQAVKSPRTEGRDSCLQTASLHPLEPG